MLILYYAVSILCCFFSSIDFFHLFFNQMLNPHGHELDMKKEEEELALCSYSKWYYFSFFSCIYLFICSILHIYICQVISSKRRNNFTILAQVN